MPNRRLEIGADRELAAEEVQRVYGLQGRFVYNHVLDTIERIEKIQALERVRNERESEIEGLANKPRNIFETLALVSLVMKRKDPEILRQIVASSHAEFLKVIRRSGVKVTYGYIGNEKEPDAKRIIFFGSMSGGKGVEEIDLSPWLRTSVEIY